MALNIVKITELPLGKRVLHLGMNGADVVELQNLLSQAGFYHYETDGIYGALTLEAVTLAQKAFDLKVDGIAGKMLINALHKTVNKSGRIIYTVKPGDSLKIISEKFQVDQRAWRSLTGQGNPQKRIYPGMKLLLARKIFFVWEEASLDSVKFAASGQLKIGWQINSGGILEAKDLLDEFNYYTINAEPEIWQELIELKSSWKEFLKQCKSLKRFKIGLDLRQASEKTIWEWEKWLREINQLLKPGTLRFLILPLVSSNIVTNQVFWLNFKKWSQYVQLIFLDHQITEEDLVGKNKLRLIVKRLGLELATRTLLLERVAGYDWNQAENTYRELSFKEAKIIHAAHFQEAKYDQATGLTTIKYYSREAPHLMVYRTLEGWLELMHQIARSNLAGLVVRDFQRLGGAGMELTRKAFAIAESFNYEK